MRKLLLLLLLTSCTAHADFMGEIGAASGGYYLDLPYGPDPAQQLDVYFPPNWATWGTNPAVVSIFGGGWSGGDKRDGAGPLHLAQIKSFLTAGYVVVNVGYRLGPTHPHPAQVHDIRRAIRWAKRNHTGIGIDPAKVFLWGESAGGHLAVMTAVALEYNDPTDYDQVTSVSVRAAGASSAPYELGSWDSDGSKKGCVAQGWLSPTNAVSKLIGADPGANLSLVSAASPMAHLDFTDQTPLLLAYGVDDCTVPEAQALRFALAVREWNPNVVVIGLAGAAHNDGVLLSPYFTSSVVSYFNRFR